MKPVPSVAVIGITLALSSCGLYGSLGAVRKHVPKMPKIAMPSMPKVPLPSMPKLQRGDVARFSLADLFPSRVPIVQVREKDLREIPLGRDKALAYQKQGAFFPSWFGGPVDFKEPSLPTGALDNPEFGLLPPKPE